MVAVVSLPLLLLIVAIHGEQASRHQHRESIADPASPLTQPNLLLP